MIALARKTLIHEWRRFVPSVFAVGFSGVLLAMQAALVLGIFGSAAIYVTASSADLWVGYPGTQSVNFGRNIGSDVEMRLRMDPDVAAVESYVWVDGDWRARAGAQGETGGGVSVRGRLSAEVVQDCVVTLEPVTQAVEEEVALRILGPEEEPSDDPDAPDEIPAEGDSVDVGEAIAEQLSLALDPYPRAPGAALPGGEEGLEATPTGPFAGLASLKKGR